MGIIFYYFNIEPDYLLTKELLLYYISYFLLDRDERMRPSLASLIFVLAIFGFESTFSFTDDVDSQVKDLVRLRGASLLIPSVNNDSRILRKKKTMRTKIQKNKGKDEETYIGKTAFQSDDSQKIGKQNSKTGSNVKKEKSPQTAEKSLHWLDDRYKPCAEGLYHVLVADEITQEIELNYFVDVNSGHCVVVNKRCPSFYKEELITYSSCADKCLLPKAKKSC